MKKFLIFSLFFLISVSSVHGATQQVIISGTDLDLPQVTTEYNSLMGPYISGGWNSTEDNLREIVPTAGRFDDLRVEIDGAPGSGNSYLFTVRLAGAGTTLACTITDPATTCQSSDGFSVTAGQDVGIEVNPDSSPTIRDASWTLTWNPTVDDETILMGNNHTITLPTSGLAFYAVHASSSNDSTEFDKSTLFPTSGTVKSLYVETAAAPGAGDQWTFAFGTVDCIISGSSDTTCNSATDSQVISAGDIFTLNITAGGSPTSTRGRWGIVFVPDTTGEFIIPSSSDNNLSNSATEYYYMHVADGSWGTTEADKSQMTQRGDFPTYMTIKNMYVQLETDPGATGKIYTFRLRANAGDATAELECILDGVKTCNASATVTISEDDLLATRSIPTDTPATGSALISYTGFIPPSPAIVLKGI